MSSIKFNKEISELYEKKIIHPDEVFKLLNNSFVDKMYEASRYYHEVRKLDIKHNDLINEFLQNIRTLIQDKNSLNNTKFIIWGSFGAQINILERKELDILAQNIDLTFYELKKIFGTGSNNNNPPKILEYNNLKISNLYYSRLTFKYKFKDYEIDLKFIDNKQAEIEQIKSYEKIKQISLKNKILVTWAKNQYQNESLYNKIKNVWYRAYFNWMNIEAKSTNR